MSASDLHEFCWQYDLADGRQLRISQRNKQLYAQINEGQPVEIDAVGTAVFIARKNGLQIKFIQYANGNVSGVQVASMAPILNRT